MEMKLYAISILLKNSALSQSFYFKSFTSADEFYKKATDNSSESPLVVEDDYNSKGAFILQEVAAVSFTDIKKDMEKQGEMEILRQKAILRAQKFADHDNGLKLLNNGVSKSAIINNN